MSSALLIDSSSSEASKAIASAGGPRFPVALPMEAEEPTDFEEPTEPTDFEKPTDISEEPTDFGSAEFVEQATGHVKDPLREFASLLGTDYILWFLRFHAKELDCHAKSGEEALNALLRDVEAADEALEHLDAMQGRADVAIVDLKRPAEALMETALGGKYEILSFSPSKRYRSRNRSGEVS